MPFSHLSQILYELEKKSSLVTRALSAKSCARDTDSLHSCTRLRLVQEMACLYHSCKILPRKHSYPNFSYGTLKWQRKNYCCKSFVFAHSSYLFHTQHILLHLLAKKLSLIYLKNSFGAPLWDLVFFAGTLHYEGSLI